MRVIGVFGAVLLAVLLIAPPLGAQSEEIASDIIHSDLPIYGHGGDNEWPQHFHADNSFGCFSRVAFGDWAFRRVGLENEDDVQWFRFTNYGVFHCWANAFRAYEREGFNDADFYPTFFVLLGTTRVGGAEVELWAMQMGTRPGSEYLLLSRAPSEGVIESFNVLQTDCPRGNVRDAGSLDILLTRYCSINSKGELIRFARRMAQRPPLGTLTRVGDAPEEDGEAGLE